MARGWDATKRHSGSDERFCACGRRVSECDGSRRGCVSRSLADLQEDVVCSCGTAGDHVIARRKTADGIEVCLWSAGQVTGAFGMGLRGVPIVQPKTGAAMREAFRAGWLLLGEVCIHDSDDLGDLYAACRWAAKRGGLPGDLRRRFAELREPKLRPVWTVLSADRDGRPTVRVWRLPRLRWPGMAVWDDCGRSDSSRGRYELTHEIAGSRGTFGGTGFRFATLKELTAHLLTVGQPEHRQEVQP